MTTGTLVAVTNEREERTISEPSPTGSASLAQGRLERTLVELDSVVGVLGRRFAEAGHELTLVGGSVRDALLDRPMPDLDFTTDADPDRILEIAGPIASAHWDIGREFGTIGLRMGERVVEITTYRAESYDPASRKPEVVFGNDLRADLLRRDFTLGAMAVRLPGLEFVDPFDGFDDLLAGVLRTPGTPEDSFSDDPLRMMRAARFIAQLGVRPVPELLAAATAMSERITIVSAERVRAELEKLMLGANPSAGIKFMVETGLADHVLPEVSALRMTRDTKHRHKDVYRHSLTVLDQAVELERERAAREGSGIESPDFVLRFAALMHDVGKPATRRFEGRGAVTFHHHDVVGAKQTAKRMRELRFDKDSIKSVARLVELHLRFYGYADAGWSDSAVRRYASDAGEQLARLHILTRSDVTTQNRRMSQLLSHAYDDLEERIAALREREELEAIRPSLDGRQIMGILGIPPGPVVGRAYAHLMEVRMDQGPLSEAAATAELQRWWAAQDPAG